MEVNSTLRPRLYTLMIDARLEEFPYVQFHIPATESRSGWLDSSEIYAEDRLTLAELDINIGGHVTLYNGVILYGNIVVGNGSILHAGCIICPDVELPEGSYVDTDEVVCLHPPSRWTKLFRTMGYFLGRFSPFKSLKAQTDESTGS